jgi:hypothetical protein
MVTFLGYQSWMDSSIECVRCHSDRNAWSSLAIRNILSRRKWSKKRVASQCKCRDCHLGNGRATDPDKAHEGMLTAFYINHEGDAVKRKLLSKKPLLREGNDHIREMLPQVRENGVLTTHPEVRNVLGTNRTRRPSTSIRRLQRKLRQVRCHPTN